MTDKFTTNQEEFWAGKFGDDYINRNVGKKWIASNVALFSRILGNCGKIDSVIEFDANIGLNLSALSILLPQAELSAIEINSQAVDKLKKNKNIKEVIHESILNYKPKNIYDLVLIKGVLIHIAPESLPQVYRKIYSTSSKFILLSEYYNPSPVEIPYRGHTGKLFKRDFAGELLDQFTDLRLVDYGFVWKRDPLFPQDDTTWFLLEKRN